MLCPLWHARIWLCRDGYRIVVSVSGTLRHGLYDRKSVALKIDWKGYLIVPNPHAKDPVLSAQSSIGLIIPAVL